MNQIFSHPGQPQMQVEVILASQGHAPCPPIYTLRMRYPRIIHAEIMTHRVFSRNARSSRAVPIKTLLAEIRNTPFVPWHWGKNQSGMQAGEENERCPMNWNRYSDFQHIALTREEAWLLARDQAVQAAQAFDQAGYHKQIVNRLIEPFMWIDTLVTATEWSNFLWLRDHAAAEPHLQDLARLVKQAIDSAEVQTLGADEWHQPYITDEDRLWACLNTGKFSYSQTEFLNRISAARCARISYKPFDGDASYERELERYGLLVGSDRVHASPLEHQASPDPLWEIPEQHGNLSGYIQYRKTISRENHA